MCLTDNLHCAPDIGARRIADAHESNECEIFETVFLNLLLQRVGGRKVDLHTRERAATQRKDPQAVVCPAILEGAEVRVVERDSMAVGRDGRGARVEEPVRRALHEHEAVIGTARRVNDAEHPLILRVERDDEVDGVVVDEPLCVGEILSEPQNGRVGCVADNLALGDWCVLAAVELRAVA